MRLQTKSMYIKRYVLRLHLKLDIELRPQISPGRLFQRLGAAEENALAPSVVSILP